MKNQAIFSYQLNRFEFFLILMYVYKSIYMFRILKTHITLSWLYVFYKLFNFLICILCVEPKYYFAIYRYKYYQTYNQNNRESYLHNPIIAYIFFVFFLIDVYKLILKILFIESVKLIWKNSLIFHRIARSLKII